MNENFIRFIIPETLIVEFTEITKEENLSVSQPLACNSVAESLNAPVTCEQVEDVAKMLTVVFSTATGIVTFLQKLKKLLAVKQATAAATNPSAKIIITLDANTDVKEAAERLIDV